MELYFWNQKEQKFELNSIPEWVGYEPMVEVAKESLEIIKANKDYKTVRNIIKAFKEVDNNYGYSDAETIYHKNIGEIASTLHRIAQNMMYLESAEDKREKFNLKRDIDNLFTKAEMLLRSLADGVVTLDGTKSQGSPFFHITDPTYDVHTYNGRDFYMWDCWYGSSLKIMEGMADKYFNE